MEFFILRKLSLQARMRSHPVGQESDILVGPFAGSLCDKYRNLMSWLILGWHPSLGI